MRYNFMNVFMNDQKLDIKLDGEKNIGEVYKSMSEWVAQAQKYILNTQIDKKELSQKEFKNIKIEDTNRVDFYVGDRIDMLLNCIEELDAYVDQVGSTLFEKESLSKDEMQHIKEGLKWCRDILNSFSSIMKTSLGDLENIIMGQAIEKHSPNSNNSMFLEQLEKKLEVFKNEHGRLEIEAFLESLRSLKTFINKLELQIRSIGAEPAELIDILKKFRENTPKLKQELIDINISFQKGNDAEALENLEKVTAKFDFCIMAIYAIDYCSQKEGESKITNLAIDSRNFYDIAQELISILKNVSEALEKGDIVALGDILEYELTEKLEQLDSYLAKIISFTQEYFKETFKENDKLSSPAKLDSPSLKLGA